MCCFFVLSDDNFSERAWPETCFESGTSFSLDDAVKQYREFILDVIFVSCFLVLFGGIMGMFGSQVLNTHLYL